MKETVSPCRANLIAQAPGSYDIVFTLTNSSERAVQLEAYQPFLQFQVRALVGASAVAVMQPELDIPVQPQTLTVPGLSDLVLYTPIRMLIEPGATSRDGMLWAVDHAVHGLVLEFTLGLPAPFDQPCRATLE
jgi:hypothetical protein